MSGPSLSTPEPALPTGSNPEGKRGIQAVMALGDFRKLWLGQIFSQLADKFYIVLMVFLIDQHLLVMGGGTGVLADMASDYGLDISTRTKVITLLATGIFVANTIPAMVLGTLAGVWADRWPKR
ncbi:MAG: MFS transporter, partial [Synechococcus sp. MOX_bin73]|nr:MFS transporter [Synechococcus sp. MOX_bin73]